MARLFTGDYSTGNFSQWNLVQNRLYNGNADNYIPDYPATIISEDRDAGYCARYEVHTGDIPEFGGNERSQVTCPVTPATGSIRWYAFSVKFDSAFPADHSSLGWGLTNGFIGAETEAAGGSATIQFGFQDGTGPPAGYWSLLHFPQSSPGVGLGPSRLVDIPLNRGKWTDVKMEIRWSPSDTLGYLRLWINGVRQTFLTGGQTFTGRTLVPGDTVVHTGQGYYRKNGIVPSGVIYHTGYRFADSEGSL